MITIKTLKLTVSALAVSAGLVAPTFADDKASLPFASEVNSCLAAVNANLDLESASRVRHLVTQRDRAGQSYALLSKLLYSAGTPKSDMRLIALHEATTSHHSST
jgi:hypothetical protein